MQKRVDITLFLFLPLWQLPAILYPVVWFVQVLVSQRYGKECDMIMRGHLKKNNINGTNSNNYE